MRIAIYSHSIAPSIDGVCRRFTGILHELERQGHDTLLFTMEERPEGLPRSTRTVFLDYMVFPSYPNKKVARPTLRSFRTIYKELKKFRPEVVHVVADGFSQFFTLAAMCLSLPIVGSFHTDILDLLSTHGAFAVQKALVLAKEAVDSIVLDACATTSKSFMAKLALQGVYCQHVIVTAVDCETFSPDKRNLARRRELMFGEEDGFLCVYVGRISGEKRLEVVIAAIQQLRDDGVNAFLAIIGDGPAALKYAKMHGKENAIYCAPRFLEHNELAEIYASSDVHVSASEFETLGNTVLEAFACGIPVVVPRTQGFRDTVQHEVDGFLFTPSDSEACARALRTLKDDPALRLQMGQNGRAALAGRRISTVVQDLLGWYHTGLQRHAQRSFPSRAFCFLLLSVLVPVTIIMFIVYDFMVNVLLKSFIHYTSDDVAHTHLNPKTHHYHNTNVHNDNNKDK